MQIWCDRLISRLNKRFADCGNVKLFKDPSQSTSKMFTMNQHVHIFEFVRSCISLSHGFTVVKWFRFCFSLGWLGRICSDYIDVIMTTMASQITSLTIVYSSPPRWRLSGHRPTKGILIEFEIRSNLGWSGLKYAQPIIKNCAHAAITLLWRVKSFDVIGRVYFKPEHGTFGGISISRYLKKVSDWSTGHFYFFILYCKLDV